jgi:hypothetical protein
MALFASNQSSAPYIDHLLGEIAWLRAQVARLSARNDDLPTSDVDAASVRAETAGAAVPQPRAAADDFDPDMTIELQLPVAAGGVVLPFRPRGGLPDSQAAWPNPPANVDAEVVDLINRVSRRLNGEDLW